MRVIWSRKARERLQEIFDFISVDSPQNAHNVIDALIDHGDGLAQFPEMGRKLPEIPSSNLRELLKYSYRIIYEVNHDHIEIVTVKHERQNIKRVRRK